MEAMSLTSTKSINPSPLTHQTRDLFSKIPAAKPTHVILKSGQHPTWSTLKTGKERWFGARCVPSGSGSAPPLAVMEIITQEEEEELTQRQEKCRGKNDISELLECLEMEAIMGEDVGKDPKDYNRRAKIFDKSSRIFQALKAQENHRG